jgi:hypothetical protein
MTMSLIESPLLPAPAPVPAPDPPESLLQAAKAATVAAAIPIAAIVDTRLTCALLCLKPLGGSAARFPGVTAGDKSVSAPAMARPPASQPDERISNGSHRKEISVMRGAL